MDNTGLNKLTVTVSERHFSTETGLKLYEKTLQPSESYAGWIGNKEVVRIWHVIENGRYLKCDEEQIRKYESLLSEWEDFNVIHHDTLGLVSTPKSDGG